MADQRLEFRGTRTSVGIKPLIRSGDHQTDDDDDDDGERGDTNSCLWFKTLICDPRKLSKDLFVKYFPQKMIEGRVVAREGG